MHRTIDAQLILTVKLGYSLGHAMQAHCTQMSER